LQPLDDHALQVLLAGLGEFGGLPWEQGGGLPARPGQPQSLQQLAALDQRQPGDQAPVQPQHVEYQVDRWRGVGWPPAPGGGAAAHALLQQRKGGAAVGAERDHLAVQYDLVPVEGVVEPAELGEPGGHVGAAAAAQPHPLVVAPAQRAVAVPRDLGGPAGRVGGQGWVVTASMGRSPSGSGDIGWLGAGGGSATRRPARVHANPSAGRAPTCTRNRTRGAVDDRPQRGFASNAEAGNGPARPNTLGEGLKAGLPTATRAGAPLGTRQRT